LAVGGKTGELKHALEDSDTITALLKEFYAKFDTAFLNIFPAFIEQFNSLLPVEEQIEIKGDDKLNTELRIFALIRLGITDSAKIAKFLRCSVTTIYTYRSKMKNKSLYRDNFDAQVMKITPYNS
jgi:DNA-binding NarL/FixJ family response regulator